MMPPRGWPFPGKTSLEPPSTRQLRREDREVLCAKAHAADVRGVDVIVDRLEDPARRAA